MDTQTSNRGGLVVVMRSNDLARACAARGWSFAELARHATVSRPTMSAALQGRRVRPRTAWKIARALSREVVPESLADLVEAP